MASYIQQPQTLVSMIVIVHVLPSSTTVLDMLWNIG